MLQRVVLPFGGGVVDEAVLPLYVEGEPPPEWITSRRGCRIPAGQRLSFATYFNAFPAGYWQHWTAVEVVDLVVTTTPGARVEVLRSDADAAVSSLTTVVVPADGQLSVPVPLKGFDDGGWLWFELAAPDVDAHLLGADWTAVPPAGAGPEHSVTIGITTFDRVEGCTALLAQLTATDELSAVVDRIIVVDQGEDTVADSPRFRAVQDAAAVPVQVLEQGNVGGSGGFARAQLETLRAGRSDAVLLLDDDVAVDPESIRRAVVYSGLCRWPTIVGGQMFSMRHRTRLHAMGEVVDRRDFWWRPVDEEHRDHDLAVRNLREAVWMHRRTDVDYNGWWMCLIPCAVLAEVGLTLPLFIKWDDAEFGLRAGRAGCPTVSLPGAAVWHMPWSAKDDVVDWHAFFHHRNRVVTALLHSPHAHGGTMVRSLLAHLLKNLVSMQYATAATRLCAVEDVFAGPAVLHPALATKLAEIAEVRSRFTDGVARRDSATSPAAGGRGRRTLASRPSKPVWMAAAVWGMLRQALPTAPGGDRAPEAVLSAAEATWWRLLSHDSVVVEAADGGGATWHRRDRQMFLTMLRRGLVLHHRLYREWPELAEGYRAALADITSRRAWEQTLDSVRRQP